MLETVPAVCGFAVEACEKTIIKKENYGIGITDIFSYSNRDYLVCQDCV